MKNVTAINDRKYEISVIIPSYKPESYLYQCLDSIKDQTLSSKKFEIILILNGCKEPYYTEIQNYISKNLKTYSIQLHQTDETGVSNARNIGLKNCMGKYITFIDDDDYISPSYLEELFSIAIKGNIPLSYLQAFSNKTGKFKKDYITAAYKKNHKRKWLNLYRVRSYFSTACCKMIPYKATIGRHFLKAFKNGEDSLYMALISDRMKNFEFTSPDAIYYRRVRENSASRSKGSFFTRFKHARKLSAAFWKIFWKQPFRYNSAFFISRIIAPFMSLFK